VPVQLKDGRKALTGECAGRVLSPEKRVQGADAVLTRGRQNRAERDGERREVPAGSETPSMRGRHVHENREALNVSRTGQGRRDRPGKVESQSPGMHALGESDEVIVPLKPSNNEGGEALASRKRSYRGAKVSKPDQAETKGKARAEVRNPTAEKVEGSTWTKGNASSDDQHRTQRRKRDGAELTRIRLAAKRDRRMQFTALLHHISVEALETAYYALNRKASAGVDGVSWQAYGEALSERLTELHNRIHDGSYRPKPARRAYIPKAGGKRRPLGVGTVEDRIVQRALTEVMNGIYEVDFYGFSYGYRPGRGVHDAADAVVVGIERRRVSWVLDADIRGFFDNLDHGQLLKLIERRIGDKRVVRLIKRMLRAGVMEAGKKQASSRGTPQGSPLSPLLANIYLHYVLDEWIHQWRQERARGDVIVVRYADDFIVGFQHLDDAQRLLEQLRERLKEYSLELHPDKTRLIEFGRFAAENRAKRGRGKPETFKFLGFTHICSTTRKGKFQVKRRSARKRMSEKLKEIKQVLKLNRHRPIAQQGQWLSAVWRGWMNHHAVPNNLAAVRAFYNALQLHWLKALRRRGQKRPMSWARFARIAKPWLDRPHILHPWPGARFDSRHSQGRSPVR